MRISAVTVGLAVVIGVPVTITQSPRQNLTGHWIQETPRPEDVGPGPRCGSQCVITLDEKTVTVSGVGPGAGTPMTLRVDGTPTSVKVGPPGKPPVGTITLTARWEGDALLITSGLGVDRLTIQDGRLVISHKGSGRGGDGTAFIYRRTK